MALSALPAKSNLLLESLNKQDFLRRAVNQGISVNFGIATFNLKSSVTSVLDTFYELYRHHPLLDNNGWSDFAIQITRPHNVRRYFYPQAIFKLEDQTPFLPLPFNQSYPLMEWGMNWCVANYFHQYLLLHAAVLEKNGQAILFPAPPGSGKSTLCSYLAHSGWRLLSDEMAVISLDTGNVHAFVRGICLKNNAIPLFKEWFPHAYVSTTAKDTSKGEVAHVRPPENAVVGMNETAQIKAIVFPRYHREVRFDTTPLNSLDCMQKVIDNAFNYNVLGKAGFKLLSTMMDTVSCYNLTYSDIHMADNFLTGLVDE